jgi:SAM-dependent methyltransferase
MSQWIDDPYERYIGRWSRLVAPEFLGWLAMPSGLRWLDVGCGTGAVSSAILRSCDPASVRGCDPSEAMLPAVRSQITDPRASFDVADAQSLPYDDHAFNVVVSGLVLNFVPDLHRGIAEMVRVARPSGTVAAYVWDYAGEMQLLRHFWEAAIAVDQAAADLDEGRRFPICQHDALQTLFAQAGLAGVSAQAIDVPTEFRDFDDFWLPFLGGAGPAGSYAASLAPDSQLALREVLRSSLPIASDGSISLIARAIAVRGARV